MAQIVISSLPPLPNGTGSGTPKGTDLIPATDTTDTTEASSGTTKKYTRAAELNYYLNALGLVTYKAVQASTIGSLTATYDNGVAGVGATLTNSGVAAAISIDGVFLSVGARVLVKNQGSAFQNGIYVVSVVGTAAINWVLTRADDMNQASDVVQYAVTLCMQGVTNTNTLWQMVSPSPYTIGTTALNYEQYTNASSNNGSANQLAWYAQSGTVVSGLPTANNGVLVTSAGGVPSISPVLPNNITATSMNLFIPQINSIVDANDSQQLSFTSVTSAVNYLDISNADSSNSPEIQSLGANANINLLLTAKGASSIVISGNGAAGARPITLRNGPNFQHATSFDFATTSNSRAITVPDANGAMVITPNPTDIVVNNLTVGQGNFKTNSNTAFGTIALGSTTTALGVTGIGDSTLSAVTTGGGNTGVGAQVAISNGFSSELVTGTNNTLIGAYCGVNNAAATGVLALGAFSVGDIATGATSADSGPGLSVGAATAKVGFRGDGTTYPTAGAPAGYWRVKINGTYYKILLSADS